MGINHEIVWLQGEEGTWCQDKIYDNDLEYVSVEKYNALRISLEEEVIQSALLSGSIAVLKKTVDARRVEIEQCTKERDAHFDAIIKLENENKQLRDGR